jgi:hypothetical protein
MKTTEQSPTVLDELVRLNKAVKDIEETIRTVSRMKVPDGELARLFNELRKAELERGAFESMITRTEALAGVRK